MKKKELKIQIEKMVKLITKTVTSILENKKIESNFEPQQVETKNESY